MEIIVLDMGHGNCVGIFDEETSPFILDCGSENNKVNNFTNIIKCEIEKSKSRDLAITHYHFDHYNLLGTLPENFFDNIYLPSLPSGSSTADAILEFLALATLSGYQEYYLIPMILTRGKNIKPKEKGDSFNAVGRSWEVLWPDYSIIDKINRRSVETFLNKIDEIKKKLSEKQLEEFDKLYAYLSVAFGRESKESDASLEEISKDKDVKPKVQEYLVEIEMKFKNLANRASLVIRDDHTNFLFTGDVDKTILNNYLNFGNELYFLVEASHHGGFYGYAFDNMSTEVIVISRKASYKPDYRYLVDLSWNIIVDTARVGNCKIWSKT
ncbi:MAG: hypothetical protein WED07_03230 [Candidatus Freyarchaeum deiterrae]